MTPGQLTDALRKLKPGAVFDMPDLLAPYRLPVLTGTPDAPIVLRGGSIRTHANPKGGLDALWIKGSRHLWIEGMVTVGGWDGIGVRECEDVILDGVTVSGSTNDGVQISMSTDCHVVRSTITGGADQAVDFYHVLCGSIEDNILDAPGSCGIYCKAGTARVTVARNRITCPADGIHLGDYTSPTSDHAPAGLRAWAIDCRAVGNIVRVGGRPLVFTNASGCSGGADDNDLATTRMVGNQPGPLVMTVKR